MYVKDIQYFDTEFEIHLTSETEFLYIFTSVKHM